MLPLNLAPGVRVMGRQKMGMYYYPGTIAEVNRERVCIDYDEGGKEWTTTVALIIPSSSPGPAARTTRNINAGGGAGGGWLIWIAVVVGVGLLRALFR